MRYYAIKVNNKKECELVQQILFRLNYTWIGGDTDVFHNESINYLYMNLDNELILQSRNYASYNVIELYTFEQFIIKMEEQL